VSRRSSKASKAPPPHTSGGGKFPLTAPTFDKCRIGPRSGPGHARRRTMPALAWPNSAQLARPFQPGTDQPESDRIPPRHRDAELAWILDLLPRQPTRIFELDRIDPQLGGTRLGMEAQHQRARERPGLRAHVADVLDRDSHFL